MEKVKIVMTASQPGFPAQGTTVEVDIVRAERWCGELAIARYAEKKRAQKPEKAEAPKTVGGEE